MMKSASMIIASNHLGVYQGASARDVLEKIHARSVDIGLKEGFDDWVAYNRRLCRSLLNNPVPDGSTEADYAALLDALLVNDCLVAGDA